MPGILPTRYFLSLGGGYWRLWSRESGLLQELPPAVVIDKETQAVKLYGQDAAQLEGKLPSHLLFRRAWWHDELVDRELARSLLRYLLHTAAPNPWKRLQLSWQTQIILPETVDQLHQRWLLRTAREAGWWFFSSQPAIQTFITQRSRGQLVRTQGVLDIGFTAVRFTVYVGDELVLAASTPRLSLMAIADQMSRYLLQEHHLEVAASVFFDQHWQQTRYVYDQQKQEARSYTPSNQDWQVLQQQFLQQLSAWLRLQLARLTQDQQAELHELGVWVIGGGADLLAEAAAAYRSPATADTSSSTSTSSSTPTTVSSEDAELVPSASNTSKAVSAANKAKATSFRAKKSSTDEANWKSTNTNNETIKNQNKQLVPANIAGLLPVPLNKVSDARYAVLRAASQNA